MSITVLFAEDNANHWRHVLAHSSAKQHPNIAAYDDDNPASTSGVALIERLERNDQRGSPRPDVILVDDWISWEAGGRPRKSAVRIAGAITQRFGDRRPVLVMWTSRQNEPWMEPYAFLSYGGHAVAVKNEPPDSDEATLQTVRKAVDAARRPMPIDDRPTTGRVVTDRGVQLVARNLDVLALLDSGASNDAIAARLSVTAGAIVKAHGRIGAALGRESDEVWPAAELCERAWELGWRWVPPDLWSYCPWSETWRQAGRMAQPRQGVGSD